MTVVELINLSPSYPLNSDVPNIFWTGKDPTTIWRCYIVEHLFMFQSIRDQKSIQSWKNGFLRYENEEFTYMFWDHVEKKIIISKDVVFFEDHNIKYIQIGVNNVIYREHPTPLLEH